MNMKILKALFMGLAFVTIPAFAAPDVKVDSDIGVTNKLKAWDTKFKNAENIKGKDVARWNLATASYPDLKEAVDMAVKNPNVPFFDLLVNLAGFCAQHDHSGVIGEVVRPLKESQKEAFTKAVAKLNEARAKSLKAAIAGVESIIKKGSNR